MKVLQSCQIRELKLLVNTDNLGISERSWIVFEEPHLRLFAVLGPKPTNHTTLSP
jgi:hypothetical protein